MRRCRQRREADQQQRGRVIDQQILVSEDYRTIALLVLMLVLTWAYLEHHGAE